MTLHTGTPKCNLLKSQSLLSNPERSLRLCLRHYRL